MEQKEEIIPRIKQKKTIPCLYCNLACIYYILEDDDTEREKQMEKFYTFMIYRHIYDEHKGIVFTKNDHPYLDEKGEIIHD